MRSLSAGVVRLSDSFNAQDVSNAVWSYAVLQSPDIPRELCNRVSSLRVGDFSVMALTQLYSAHLASTRLGWSVFSLLPEVLSKAKTVLLERAKENIVSEMQRKVYAVFQSLGLNPKLETMIDS